MKEPQDCREMAEQRWPFVETPAQFADRLSEAMTWAPSLLSALRHVLIEKPAMLAAAPPPATSSAVEALPDDIRAKGWAVAVHNDYRQNGEPHTFWLFTKDDRAIKGEGRTDAEALEQVRAALQAGTEVAVKDAARLAIANAFVAETGRSTEDLTADDYTSAAGGSLLGKAWHNAGLALAALAPVQQAGVESELVERLETGRTRLENATWEDGAASDYVRRVLSEGAELCRNAAASLSQLQQRIEEVEAENKRWQENWDANVAEMSERFRAVNIQRVIEASGHDITALAARAEAAEAALAAKDAKLAEAVAGAFEEAAELHEVDAQEYNRIRDPGMANHQRKYARVFREKAAAIRARSFTSSIQEKGNG